MIIINLFIIVTILAIVRVQSKVIMFQNGRVLNSIKTGPTVYAATSIDTAITNIYNASWNNYNGVRFSGEETHDVTFGQPTYMSNILMSFTNMKDYIPVSSNISKAELTLSFTNWGPVGKVAACFITKPWSGQNVYKYHDTGYRFNQYNTKTSKSEQWTQPGGWADCDARFTVTFTVYSNGNCTRTIPLDPAIVQEWVRGNSSIYGLMFKAMSGTTVSIQSSANQLIAQRPALILSYTNDTSVLPPKTPYPKVWSGGERTIWVDHAKGNDITGTGDELYPFRTPLKALTLAFSGDTINLKSGIYGGGLNVWQPNVTIQSAPGHWAVISGALNDPASTTNVIQIRTNAGHGTMRNLEISGGYYYGVYIWSDWGNYDMNGNMHQAAAASYYTFDNVRIHGTGSSCMKMIMKVNHITIKNSELYDCGTRFRTYGHGIEGVQVYGITIQDSYIHDLPGAGIHLAGGSAYNLIQRNRIANVGFGMNIGFAMEYEYMNPLLNPLLYENMHTVVANNIISATLNSGINIWAGLDITVAQNTIWNSQQLAQSAILLNSYRHSDAPGSPTQGCSNITIIGNILAKSETARAGPVFQIRTQGLSADASSYLIMAYNVYYDYKGIGSDVFQWGQGAMLEDERVKPSVVGNSTMWKLYCANVLHLKVPDIHSIEGDPKLDSNFMPLSPCSPAVGRVDSAIYATLPDVLSNQKLDQYFHDKVDFTVDVYGNKRAPTKYDVGAVSTTVASGVAIYTFKPFVFTGIAPYQGVGLIKEYYDSQNWPLGEYGFWLTHKCIDIKVDAVTGTDNQAFNYESTYTAFKTVQAALISINQCDRILLKGGQVHAGPFGIYRPNVTIMTDPDDVTRATVLCDNIGDHNCIMVGDGLFEGSPALTLSNFNVIMTGSTGVNCIHLNEGYSGAYLPFWKFYIDSFNRQQYDQGRAILRDMHISGCTVNGVKLSTLITGVQMQRLVIGNVKGTGIEIRNGNNVTIEDCHIANITGSAIVMGGGAKNNIVRNNLIENFGVRGIIVGSDNTEVQYMDVEFATKSPNGTFHDAINITIYNNIIAHGQGAGVAFYSARDVVCVHNTIVDVAQTMQAGVLFNVSPKLLNQTTEILLANKNITFKNNIVAVSDGSQLPVIEIRIMQGTVYPITPPLALLPSATVTQTCDSTSSSRKLMTAIHTFITPAKAASQGRNTDGSCPIFPDTNAWHADVSAYKVHPNSELIKQKIAPNRHLHPDFGGHTTVNGHPVYYGIPFTVLNSKTLPPIVGNTITVANTGYPDECDYPLNYPFQSPSLPVEGTYLNCPDTVCGGDRHVLVIDNSTCTLYETWRTLPPGITGQSTWTADIAVKFDLLSNKQRPLGWTSSDAAGLPVYAGLVKFDEVINKGVIDHALRFTGPNSQAAYAFPASHYAPAGDTGPNSPWMGLRVRLRPDYDCTSLKRVARIFCVALQKYGGIFADNGSPWFFSGEATPNWIPYYSEINDIYTMLSTDFEVLDVDCLCLTSDCAITSCGGGGGALPVYTALNSYDDIDFDWNAYYAQSPQSDHFIDRKAGFLGTGFRGDLSIWQSNTNDDAHSVEMNPHIDYHTYLPTMEALGYTVPALPFIKESYDHCPILGSQVHPGVIIANCPKPTTAPTSAPSISPTAPSSAPIKETRVPSKTPTMFPTIKPTKQPASEPPKPPTSAPTVSTTTKVIFQNGRTLNSIVNGPTVYLSKAIDSAITNMYIDSWNNYNGIRFSGGSSQDVTFGQPTYMSTVLMSFTDMKDYIPVNTVITKAELTLSFVNWDLPTKVAVCFITKPWSGVDIAKYKDTGYRFNQYNTKTASSEQWTQPGGWADCDPRFNATIAVNNNGNSAGTFTLNKTIVQQWINGNSGIYGLLFKAVSGKTVHIQSSANSVMSQRPALTISYPTVSGSVAASASDKNTDPTATVTANSDFTIGITIAIVALVLLIVGYWIYRMYYHVKKVSSTDAFFTHEVYEVNEKVEGSEAMDSYRHSLGDSRSSSSGGTVTAV